MAMIELCGFAFAYGAGDSPVVGPLSLEIEEGAFCLVTGPTGSGKTTLLRACKPELAPHGAFSGSLDVRGVRLVDDGRATGAMPAVQSARSIGFVMQDPDAQIVCDTVWHELAFGLENLGVEPALMRRRVAEVAHFLGIAPWVERRCADLSGGQKQLLNLASALVMRPPLLLLDEPLAQLDPAARRQFVGLLARVQLELGLTVVVATHLPEEWEGAAGQVVELEGARSLIAGADTGGTPNLVERSIAEGLRREARNVLPMERSTRFSVPCPMNRDAASTHAGEHGFLAEAVPLRESPGDVVVSARDVFLRFESSQPWVLRGLDLEARVGTAHAVVGGNGCGKTTLLRALAGELKCRRGKVRNALAGEQAYLPQDPKAVFACDSVAEELREWQARAGYSDADADEAARAFGLAGLEGLHPFDLSGGQRQMLALAKMLLARPRLLLLDEPAKGLDPRSRAQVAAVLRGFADAGGTVVFATHDLDLVAECADEATLLFDGQAACTQTVPQFFEDNLIWRPQHPLGESR